MSALRLSLAALAIAGLLLCGAITPARSAVQQPSCVLVAELRGVVNSGSARHLADAVRETERRGCSALLVEIDTPGGMLDSTREIVQAFLAAPVPIVTYVTPAGARAGSAGMFITLAGHVAVMAPGSNIGAAHPVTLGGGDPGASDRELAKKVENDAAAFARAIAERRKRNVAWAEAAVRDSLSQTAEEAEQHGVIDLLAGSRTQLLEQIHGRSVSVEGGQSVLATRGAEIAVFPMSIQQRVLVVLGDPNLAYVLLMIGMLGIMIELYNPGMFVPAIVGVGALLLAAIGLGALPVTWGGILLLAIAAGLFLAEVWVTSYGVLAACGLAALLLGSALLFDRRDPDFFADRSVRLSWTVVAPLALVIAGAAAGLAWSAARDRKRALTTGREALLGANGRALAAIGSGAGEARVWGERWRAISDAPIEAGARIRVIGIEGLTLRVEPNEENES